jgi:hypothetical protein
MSYVKQSPNGPASGRIINSSRQPRERRKRTTTDQRILQRDNSFWSFNPIRELSPGLQLHIRSLFYEARVYFDEGRQLKEAKDHNEEFKKIFQERTITSKCFTTDGSKMEDRPFVEFASIDIKDGRSRKFRIAKIHGGSTSNWRNTSNYRKSRPGAKFRDFLGLGKRVKRYQ